MSAAITLLKNPRYLLVLGDQIAGGHEATGLNLPGGRGHARLLLDNAPGFPEWDGWALAALFPGLELVDVSREGATSTRARANLERALVLGVIPAFISGDLLVLIHVGSNDFFASGVLFDSDATREAAQRTRASLAIMISLLRQRYEKPPHRVVVLVGNLFDPTDGTGDETYLSNLEEMNHTIAREAAVRGALLLDAHAALQGHGLTAGARCWLTPDGLRLLDPGHDALRQAAWSALLAERTGS